MGDDEHSEELYRAFMALQRLPPSKLKFMQAAIETFVKLDAEMPRDDMQSKEADVYWSAEYPKPVPPDWASLELLYLRREDAERDARFDVVYEIRVIEHRLTD